MQRESYTFLCSAIIVDEYERLLFEETFLVGAESESEADAMHAVVKKLEEIETSFHTLLNRQVFLSCHCLFTMSNEVSVETLSTDILFEVLPGLQRWRK